jgi:hypothetical protein
MFKFLASYLELFLDIGTNDKTELVFSCTCYLKPLEIKILKGASLGPRESIVLKSGKKSSETFP